MPSPDPAAVIDDLLKQAAATDFCRPALRKLSAAFPPDDSILTAALNEAAARRAAKPFSNLYVAALLHDRRIPAQVLEMGAALLPDTIVLLHTALRLEGNVAESLAAAIQSGRMGTERDATALIAAWLDYERRDLPAPPEFLVLTRKVCRQTVRMGNRLARSFLCISAKLSGDPVVAKILNANIGNDRNLDLILAEIRASATGPAWERNVPGRPVEENTLGSGATVKRAIPKAGRNDPCPCGSGRKFKQCCDGKTSAAETYEMGGVTISEAAAHPELFLTKSRIREMRSYELYTLNPKLLIPPVAGDVALRLAMFREIPRAIEMLKAAGPDSQSFDTLYLLAHEFHQARESEALRWLVDWAPEAVELTFEMEILLADPGERMRLLQERARDAVEAERSGDATATAIFADIGHAALAADPALGLLIARGVLPVCGWENQSVLIEDIEDARDLLGLDENEPGYEIIEATEQASIDQERHAIDLEKVRKETASRVKQRDLEIERLRSRIEGMQDTLAQRENAAKKEKRAATEEPTVSPSTPAAPTPAETRELRDELRRLKDNLKVEHDERNRALRDLRAALEQLRRSSREKSEKSASSAATDQPDEADEPSTVSVGWESQGLRIPEYSDAFCKALRSLPRQASATALAAAGRLAGGDPSIWKTVRALKLRPGTLRVRIAGDYRLLFEIGPADTLRLTDLILRRDLDRWLSGGGR